MSDKPSWASYDHLEAARLDDPARLLAELSAKCPVGHSEMHGGFYVVTSYEGCTVGTRDARFSSSLEKGVGPGFPYGAKRPVPTRMISDDGRRHRDFRTPLQETFSITSVEAMVPRVRSICRELVNDFIEKGEADLVEQYAVVVPATVIGDLLSLPAGQRQTFQDYARKSVAGDQVALNWLADFTDGFYEERSRNPGDDIPSQILKFEIEGHPITKEEWRGMIMILILAGLETTANGAALVLHLIAERNELRQYLLADRSRIAGSMNEMLRYLCPVPQSSRSVIDDVTIDGQPLKKNDVVELSWLAANRDPNEFENPNELIPDRKPNRHMAFGHGVHRCLGSHLALKELTLMTEEVLARIPDYRVLPGGIERYASLNRGVNHLRVAFTPGVRV